MGQVLQRLSYLEALGSRNPPDNSKAVQQKFFPDLHQLPPEISLTILSNLNATDLCLAACVWDNLANDDMLWHGLCRKSWGYSSIYHSKPQNLTYKQIYLMLDEASLTFNASPMEGESYLISRGLVRNEPAEFAKFLHFTQKIRPDVKTKFLDRRREVLEIVLQLQDFENQFLPNALRKFFNCVSAPQCRGDYLEQIIDKFSERFCKCNPKFPLSKDAVFVVCFSLIMLSVDLASPHVKNKMSKREFIKNTCRAAQEVDGDLAGHLYDNIYLIGHVAADHL